jgi:hypothetical protein
MRYTPKDQPTDPRRRPDERRTNRAQDNRGDNMGLWLAGLIAGLLVVMLGYGYTRGPISVTGSALPSSSSTTGAAPVNPLPAIPAPAPDHR